MLEPIGDFLSAGGKALWLIFFVLIGLWFFILERFYYFYQVYPMQKKQAVNQWIQKTDKQSWLALKQREEAISVLTKNLFRHIPTIKTLINVSPLLGLLGTITGMISIFDVIAISGTGNPRLMASGISLAVIPTMAGLVTALSGLYFAGFFEKKGQKEKQIFTQALKI